MDFEKILEYRFWILLPLAVLLAVIGWWMGTGYLSEQAEARETAVEQAKSNLETIVNATPPSEADIEVAEGLQQYQAEIVSGAWETLYHTQQESLEWPQAMPTPPPLQWPEGTPSGPIDPTERDRYRYTYYRELWEAVTERARIYDPETQEGVLVLEADLPRYEWEGMPSTRQIWLAQENLWATHALIEAIAQVNRSANRPHDAPIPALRVLVIGSESGTSGGTQGFLSGGVAPPLTMSQPTGTQGGHSSGSSGSQSEAAEDQTGRYVETDQFRLLPFRLTVRMEHAHIPDLLIALAESSVERPGRPMIPVEVTRVTFSSDMASETRSLLGGRGGDGSSGSRAFEPPRMSGNAASAGAAGRTRATAIGSGGRASGQSRPPLLSGPQSGTSEGSDGLQFDEPTLADVTIVGQLCFFKPPPSAQGGVSAGGASPAARAAAALDAEQPAEVVVPAPEEEEPAAEQPDSTSDEAADEEGEEDAGNEALPEDLTDEAPESGDEGETAPADEAEEAQAPEQGPMDPPSETLSEEAGGTDSEASFDEPLEETTEPAQEPGAEDADS